MGRNQNLSGSNDSLKKGAWTATEDQILIDYVKKNGEGKWERVQKHTGENRFLCVLESSPDGLRRCGKSCRLRWLNYLRPNIKRGNISNDEEELIIRLHKLLGNRWSLIAGRLPGRTDNEIKNYWNSKLRKKLQLGGKPPKNSKSKRSNNAIKDAAARVDAVEDHLLDRAQEAYIVNPEGPIRNSVAMLGDDGGSAFPVAGDGCSWDLMVDCKVGGDSSLSEFLDSCLMGVGEACTQMASSSQHENMFDQPCVHSPSEDLIKPAGDLSEEMLSKWAAELID